jgi:hypothetical protein
MRHRGQTLLPLLLGSTLLFASALPAAAAGKPTFDPVPFPPDGILLPGGVFCEFDLFAEATRNTEIAKTFPADENGDVLQIVTGQLWILFTNMPTGATAEINISGPIRYVIHPDGTIDATLLGRLVAVEVGGFLVYSGRVIQVIHPDGSTEILSTQGSTLDVCALLSD